MTPFISDQITMASMSGRAVIGADWIKKCRSWLWLNTKSRNRHRKMVNLRWHYYWSFICNGLIHPLKNLLDCSIIFRLVLIQLWLVHQFQGRTFFIKWTWIWISFTFQTTTRVGLWKLISIVIRFGDGTRGLVNNLRIRRVNFYIVVFRNCPMKLGGLIKNQ